jgi:phage terminase large subunit-like protein
VVHALIHCGQPTIRKPQRSHPCRAGGSFAVFGEKDPRRRQYRLDRRTLRHSRGAGRRASPSSLRSWQRDEIRKVYDNPHGTRTAIVSFGKKNAKTTLAAFLLLLHLSGPEAKRNNQLVSTAQSRDQAAVLFALAAKIVRMSPTLSVMVSIRDTHKELYDAELGTLYQALVRRRLYGAR